MKSAQRQGIAACAAVLQAVVTAAMPIWVILWFLGLAGLRFAVALLVAAFVAGFVRALVTK